MGHKFSAFCFTKLQKRESNIFVFSVVAFDTIKIQICLATQNDPLNLRFVKDTNVVGKKMTKNGLRIPITIATTKQAASDVK